MDNSDFWASVAALVKEGFAPEGLSKLERYAEQFISGQLVYKRFSPLEQHGCAAGGASHVIATLLAGAETQADKDASGANSFQRERQRGAQEAERIEHWARTVGIWIDRWTTCCPGHWENRLPKGARRVFMTTG